MLDIEFFRNFDQTKWNDYANKRHLDHQLCHSIIEQDKICRNLLTEVQNIKQQINVLSEQFANLVKNNEKEQLAIIKKQVNEFKKELANKESEFDNKKAVLDQQLMRLPNIPLPEVPNGVDEKENVVQKYFMEPTKFDFTPLAHWDLIVKKGMVDLEAAQRISGSRYVIYKQDGAKLIRALQWFTLDCNINHGYIEYLPPVIVDQSALYNTGQLPKFEEDLYKLTEDKKYLSPTAEVQLTNLFANSIIDPKNLPYNFTANTSCFRSEAGSAGKDTRGVIRQHQFYKTELVKVVLPTESIQAHEQLTKDAEFILEALKLPYRRILLCSGDMGFGAAKTYDLEVWLPSYNDYKEISSCSNCWDFQARRMKMRTKDAHGKTIYVHTLNGSALAIDRLFAAVVENYQQADGSILIPEVLIPYMNKPKI